MNKQKIMGVINLIHETDELDKLTHGRCTATVPFGSRYRIIDFTLSNMVNSGIQEVGIFVHKKYRSLMDHIGSGKSWDLQHRQSGLFILPPITDDVQELSRGDLFHFYQNRDYFLRSKPEYVLITRSHMVCNIDFRKVLDFHLEKEADITVVCHQSTEPVLGKARKVRMDGSGRIVEIQDSYGRMLSDYSNMEMYLMKKDLLMDLVETSLAKGQDHLVRHAIFSKLEQLNVYGYVHDGFLAVVNTINSYYGNSMKLLDSDVWRKLFYEPGPIFTKVKDGPPARYSPDAIVSRSIIANGCLIEGTVRNSILFRGVHVHKGAVVEDSIIMQNGVILPNSIVKCSIFDKDVVIEENREVKGVSSGPYLAGKRKVI
ncbi:glucose-1-phosphate adenylyltransferase subunit GlgD [Paenibacillus montaniterrae]|uniref:Glucose-1-phosphate adenylyltransferase subunit GlgD n=1 Tax=Paenibacillus montaniterrae TaxID=429341 RepID=A0A920CXG6_9BACL|nr:glucose-1-phosphate adenylyltransferase subunit GlgD [Paenibacillus montaniterrae]GIP15293.1 glucose-1-phosphate adenylyltransferase subunit GlgD [Paenibacillus montaniterrae]